MSCQITYTQSFNIHPSDHILGTCTFTSVPALCLQFTSPASRKGIPAFLDAWEGCPPEHEWAIQNKWGTKQKWPSETQSSTYASSHIVVQPLLPNATSIPSIQPCLGLPHTHPPLTSSINTFQAMPILNKLLPLELLLS